MGMYTTIVEGNTSVQIKTGVDSCEVFKVGDPAPVHMDDAVYDGLASKPGQDWKDYRDVWVIVHHRKIQMVLYNREEGDSIIEAVTEYLTFRGEHAPPTSVRPTPSCEGCMYCQSGDWQCLMPPHKTQCPSEIPCEGCGVHSKKSHHNGAPKYMYLCEKCVDLRLKLTKQGSYYEEDT